MAPVSSWRSAAINNRLLIDIIVAQMLYFVDEDRPLLGLAPAAGDLGTEGSLGDCAGMFGGRAEPPAMDSLPMSSTLPVVIKSPHTQHRAGCSTKSARQPRGGSGAPPLLCLHDRTGRHGEMLWSHPIIVSFCPFSTVSATTDALSPRAGEPANRRTERHALPCSSRGQSAAVASARWPSNDVAVWPQRGEAAH